MSPASSHNIPVIRFASFLAPNIYRTYEHIVCYVGEKIDMPTLLSVGQCFEEFELGQVDAGFVCGLPYAHLADSPACPVELLAAPVLRGERYQNRPIYFSDVVVRNDSPYASFDDLAGCTWAYNQSGSHSGYNVVCYSLLERGKTLDHFGKLIESGSHERSLQMVLKGQADATAIDSQVLDVLLMQHRELAGRIRVIAMLGPSSIPPVVVARRLDSDLQRRMREALLSMHRDSEAARALHEGGIDHFVPVVDADYQDIREMFRRMQQSAVEIHTL